MKTVQIKLYNYSELKGKAKQKAQDWLAEIAAEGNWWAQVYEDAAQAGLVIKGFDLGRGQFVDLEFDTSPATHFGTAQRTAEEIMAAHGKDCDTYKAAHEFMRELEALGDRPTDEDEDADDSAWEIARDEQTDDFKKALAGCYWKLLQAELEYLQSEAYLADLAEGNDWTFTEKGERFDG